MFIFKLQSVLDYRINIEEKILNEFSKIRRELDEAELKLKNLIQERANLIDALRKLRNKSLHIDDITLYISYVEQVREDEKKQKILIDQIKEKLEAKRQELIEAVKKKKVMEKLKERHTDEYESTMRMMEQKNFDEMAVLKFGRRDK